ncbi:MAG: polysaccharide deacetylase [Nitrococcus mobilis]|nr:polysaccharide deacetylase [Nitrococcus mobilis]
MSEVTHTFITVDVEMWPPHWEADGPALRDAFRRYIHGVGRPAQYGLPYQLAVLSEHGLRAVFFVEPLFASALGRDALAEVVGMIREADQEVQLHLHPEWLGRAGHPDLPGPYQLAVKALERTEQQRLIELGKRWLQEAGAGEITAFRAGSFGADRRTLAAARASGIVADFSQNAAGPHGPIDPAIPDDLSVTEEGVIEVPLTTYRDFTQRLRPLQVGSSGIAEINAILDICARQRRAAVSILSHSAELLDARRQRVDPVVLQRFLGLCQYLARHRDRLPTATTGNLRQISAGLAPSGAAPLRVPHQAAARRYVEQLRRRSR